MWICEECEWKGTQPKWAQQEWKDSFIEVPYCPKCGSYHVVDDPTADYEIFVGEES